MKEAENDYWTFLQQQKRSFKNFLRVDYWHDMCVYACVFEESTCNPKTCAFLGKCFLPVVNTSIGPLCDQLALISVKSC